VKHRSSPFIPPKNVIAMIVMLALITGAIFTAILGDWIGGALVGLGLAAAIYLLIVVDARRKTKKRRR
jgi:uncharacterized membrane protein YoaK (UPF0700 family)